MEVANKLESGNYAADISSIKEAQQRINSFIHKTSVLSSDTLNSIAGRKLFFKCECFQKGNLYRFINITQQLKLTEATVTVNIGAFKFRGACNGTISLELLDQIPQIDTIIVPISGGGLISGVALAAKSINPNIRILAAEPRGANDASLSMAAGEIVTLPQTDTVADGLRAFLGDLTCPVEPSGATGLAAVLSATFLENPSWKDCNNVAVILSGGNVDLGVLWESFNK
ncbi:hypothetical protein MKX01_016862 [Papaver californicum]|nr:hypothetical protein MKX01_016862 [Papaver californicum]